ncbi:MAG: hypothetical protein R3C15_23730 [Thermoleophilia bacterium]
MQLRTRTLAVVPLAATAAVFAVAGCGGSSTSAPAAPAPAPAPATAPAPTPAPPAAAATETHDTAAMSDTDAMAMMTVHTGATVSIDQPAGGAVVEGNAVDTHATFGDFQLDCTRAGTANTDGSGHYHLELDHSLIDMFCSEDGRISLQDVAPGEHTIQVVPAANDHAEDHDALKEVAFEYQPTDPLPAVQPVSFDAPPSIRIVSPAAGATVSGEFDLTVEVQNFNLSCDLYGKHDVAGYGHWHANVDTTTEGMMGMATMLGMSCANTFHVSLAGIAPGEHTFFAILENNLHAPTPEVQAQVTVNVA